MTAPANPTPQFSTASYDSGDQCSICKQPLGASYYRVNGAVACASCTEKARTQMPKDSHGAFTRAVIFGIGGAIAGLLIYSGFAIITGIIIGYVSLAVGFIVAKAIMTGTRGLGGFHYQVLAVILTYAAVSLAAVPIAISQSIKQKEARIHARTELVAPPGGQAQTSPDAKGLQTEEQPVSEPMSFGTAMGKLVVIGLASPFLALNDDPVSGGIGLIILLVGIRIAWKMTEGSSETQIVGPFQNRATAPSPG